MRLCIHSRGTRALFATLAAGTVFALAGCEGGSGSGVSTAGSSESAKGGADREEADGPLTKWFNSLMASGLSNEEEKALYKKSEEWIATCMQGQGFAYVPVDDWQDISSLMETDGPKFGSKEWAAQNGYGAFTKQGDAPVDEDTTPPDPNQAAMDAMSESERDAYVTALYGDGTGLNWDDPNFDFSSLTDKQKGCSGRAGEAVPRPGADLSGSEEMRSVEDDMGKLRDSLENNPALTEPNAKWADCMANVGYAGKGWTKPADPATWYQDAATKTMNDAMANVPDGTLWKDAPHPTESDERRKSAEEEKDTAVADFTCRDSTGYTQAEQKARFAAEKEFMDTHKEQIGAINAMVEGSAQ